MSQTQDLYMYRPTYLGKRTVSRGSGGSTSSYKRRGKASSVSSKRVIQQLVGKKSIKATFSKLVREVAEKKSTNTDPLKYVFNLNNTTCSPAVDLMSISLDAIAHGSLEGQRIGNEIYVHEMTVKLSISMATLLVLKPGFVQIWIGTLKDSPSSTPNAADLTKLYDDGGGAVGPDGTVLATLRNLNYDYFNIKHYSIHKLGYAATSSGSNNNDFPMNIRMKIPNLVKGRVRYNDTTAACNKYMFMWMAFTTYDGSIIPGTNPVECDYYVSCKYSDV